MSFGMAPGGLQLCWQCLRMRLRGLLGLIWACPPVPRRALALFGAQKAGKAGFWKKAVGCRFAAT